MSIQEDTMTSLVGLAGNRQQKKTLLLEQSKLYFNGMKST